ncbi:hypothetical protein IPG41_02575 [Candidatus Peregrinibacteria bacterium]|nr:MAG: hypothetical protein IPG41_02575 [Candidatus Peregrinibacteria bacterium]
MNIFLQQKNRSIRLIGEAYLCLALLTLAESVLLLCLRTPLTITLTDPFVETYLAATPLVRYFTFLLAHFVELTLGMVLGGTFVLGASLLFLKGKYLGQWMLRCFNFLTVLYSFYWAYKIMEYAVEVDMNTIFLFFLFLFVIACGIFPLWINKKMNEPSIKKCLS